MIALLLASALAGDLVLAEQPPTRRLKFEAYFYAPSHGKRRNLDWQTVDLEFWSGLLVCQRIAPHDDRCAFEGEQLEFGYQITGESEIRRFSIPAPPDLEVRYSPQGKLKQIAPIGNRDAFRVAITDTLLHRFANPQGQSFTADTQREVGQGFEEELRWCLSGALELPLPKDGEGHGSKGWKAKAPGLAQLWSGSAYGGQIKMFRDDPVDGRIPIEGLGRFGEMNPLDPNSSTKGQIRLDGRFDPARGVPTEIRTHVEYTVWIAGYPKERLAVMREAIDGDTYAAGDIAKTPLNPK